MSIRHQLMIITPLLLAALAPASSTVGYTGGLDTTMKIANTGSGKAIVGTADGYSTVAVEGRANGAAAVGVYGHGENVGVRGEGALGVEGISYYGPGLQGASTYGYGLWAQSSQGTAIGAQGESYGVFAGAAYSGGTGVWAAGETGVTGYSSSSGGTGVSAVTTGSGGANKALDAYAYGGSTAYGVYASAAGASQNWAGYFAGNVHVTGSLSWVSDAQFKKNVRPLENGLEKVMALRPKAYEMKVEEFKGRVRLAEGGQFGLIAQEVEAVLPEIVQPVNAPSEASPEEMARGGGAKSKSATSMTSYKSVNYLALIPVLIEAVQEQQKLIQAQQARIETLEAKAGAR